MFPASPTEKGELKHLDFAEADFNYRDFVRALKETGVGGYVICESPNLEMDARLLKEPTRLCK